MSNTTMANIQQANISSSSSTPSSSTSPSTPATASSTTQTMLFVEPNSDQELNEMFGVLDGANTNPKARNIPTWRQRNLPDSFFSPYHRHSGSSSTSHSRESSLDASSPLNSVNKQATQTQNHNNTSGKPPTPILATTNSPLSPGRSHHCTPPPGLPIIHQKAHSLPASLPQYKYSYTDTLTLAAANNPAGQQQQLSTGPMAVKSISGTRTQHQLPQQAQQQQANVHVRQQSYDINKIPLPDGWGMSYDAHTGERYFIDHKQKITTWDDPRTVKLNQLNTQQLSHSNPIMNEHNNEHAIIHNNTAAFSSQPNINHNLLQHQVNLNQAMQQSIQQTPQQQTLQQTPFVAMQPKVNNEFIYQIRTDNNNPTTNNKTTNNPRLGVVPNNNIQLELVSAMENMNTSSTAPNNQNNNNGNMTTQVPASNQQQQQYLIDLQMERKRLRQRQEEINKNPTMRSDYIPLQQTVDGGGASFLRDANATPTSNDTSNHNQHQDVSLVGHLSTLNSCAMNNNSTNGANFFNDFSLNRLATSTATTTNIPNINDLSTYETTFQLSNTFDLESLDFIEDLDQFINTNNTAVTGNDLTATINHDETMTWQV